MLRLEETVTDFERQKPMVVQRLLDPVLDLVEREGINPSDDSILTSYEHLAQPAWLMFVPMVNFGTDAPTTKIGHLFEMSSFTPQEKTALWDEHFLVQGDMITLRQFENARFRLIGRTMVTLGSPPDVGGELRRIITALRLLKPGRVGTPAMFSKSSMLTLYGGSVASLSDYSIDPMSLYGDFPKYELVRSELSRLLDLYEDIRVAEEAKRLDALTVAVRRFNQAYARNNAEDRIIDFCIALESSLLWAVQDELSYRLSLRGAALLAAKRVPESTRWLLHKIYEVRSGIVHDGKTLPPVFGRKASPCFSIDISLDEACEDVVREILCAYIRRLATGESLRDVNDELERRLVLGLADPVKST